MYFWVFCVFLYPAVNAAVFEVPVAVPFEKYGPPPPDAPHSNFVSSVVETEYTYNIPEKFPEPKPDITIISATPVPTVTVQPPVFVTSPPVIKENPEVPIVETSYIFNIPESHEDKQFTSKPYEEYEHHTYIQEKHESPVTVIVPPAETYVTPEEGFVYIAKPKEEGTVVKPHPTFSSHEATPVIQTSYSYIISGNIPGKPEQEKPFETEVPFSKEDDVTVTPVQTEFHGNEKYTVVSIPYNKPNYPGYVPGGPVPFAPIVPGDFNEQPVPNIVVSSPPKNIVSSYSYSISQEGYKPIDSEGEVISGFPAVPQFPHHPEVVSVASPNGHYQVVVQGIPATPSYPPAPHNPEVVSAVVPNEPYPGVVPGFPTAPHYPGVVAHYTGSPNVAFYPGPQKEGYYPGGPYPVQCSYNGRNIFIGQPFCFPGFSTFCFPPNIFNPGQQVVFQKPSEAKPFPPTVAVIDEQPPTVVVEENRPAVVVDEQPPTVVIGQVTPQQPETAVVKESVTVTEGKTYPYPPSVPRGDIQTYPYPPEIPVGFDDSDN